MGRFATAVPDFKNCRVLIRGTACRRCVFSSKRQSQILSCLLQLLTDRKFVNRYDIGKMCVKRENLQRNFFFPARSF